MLKNQRGQIEGGGGVIKQLSGDAFIEATIHDHLGYNPLQVIVTGISWESALWKGTGPLQTLLLQWYDIWVNHSLTDIIRGLQSVVKLEDPKLRQAAVVKRIVAEVKKIPHRQFWIKLRKVGIPLEKIDGKPTSELYMLWKERNLGGKNGANRSISTVSWREKDLEEKDGAYRNIAAVPSAPLVE